MFTKHFNFFYYKNREHVLQFIPTSLRTGSFCHTQKYTRLLHKSITTRTRTCATDWHTCTKKYSYKSTKVFLLFSSKLDSYSRTLFSRFHFLRYGISLRKSNTCTNRISSFSRLLYMYSESPQPQ